MGDILRLSKIALLPRKHKILFIGWWLPLKCYGLLFLYKNFFENRSNNGIPKKTDFSNESSLYIFVI